MSFHPHFQSTVLTRRRRARRQSSVLLLLVALSVGLAFSLSSNAVWGQISPLSPLTGPAADENAAPANQPGPISPVPAPNEQVAQPLAQQPAPAPQDSTANSPGRNTLSTSPPAQIPLGEPLKAQTSLYLIGAILASFIVLILVVVVRRREG